MTLWLLLSLALLAAGAAPRRLGAAGPPADTNSIDPVPTAPDSDVPKLPKPTTPPPAADDEDDDSDEDTKTLSQQIADGKYGLIQKELYREPSRRPGILSYAANPEVPRDTARTLGGLRPAEIWLAEDHVLVLRGGSWPPDSAANRTERPPWPPIDDYRAPPRQVKLPARPRVPPPFPVQLSDGEPPRLLGNQTGRPSFFAPPFPFGAPGSAPANVSQEGAPYPPPYPYAPPGNFPPGGGFFFPPPGAGAQANGSLSRPPYPFPPPSNGSLYGPAAPGDGSPPPPPFFPFPFPPPQGNGSFPPYPFPPPRNGSYPPFPFPPPRNGSFPPYPLPFPPPVNGSLPPFFPALPPGAVFLPPPGNYNDTFDEDDMSIYYPPPYDFYYPTDNTTQVPPGPLVPGIILPPPPNFFAPFDNETDTNATTTTQKPPFTGKYVPVTTQNRRKKPVSSTTPSLPHKDAVTTTAKPAPAVARRPVVQVTHTGDSPLAPPQAGYYYEAPTLTTTAAPPLLVDVYSSTPAPPGQVSYVVVPVTDIVVRPKQQPSRHNSVSSTTTKPQPTSPSPSYYFDKSSGGGERSPKKSYYFFEEPRRGLSFEVPLPSPTLQTLLEPLRFQQPAQLYYYLAASKQKPAQQYRPTPAPQYYQTSSYYQLPPSSTPAPLQYYRPSPTPAPLQYYQPSSTQRPQYYNLPQHYQQRPSNLDYYNGGGSVNGPSTSRPVYQYSFQASGASIPSFTTARPRLEHLAYQTTPRTVFEFSYQQQPQRRPSFTHEGASGFTASEATAGYTRPRPQSVSTGQAPGVYYTTANPLSAFFTQQDEGLFDENTRKYFTIFGQKLGQDAVKQTTPMPPTAQQPQRHRVTTARPATAEELDEEGGAPALPLSLEGDTLVNYRPPLPPTNPDSELIAYQLPGDGAHAYFLSPGSDLGYSYPAPPQGQRLRYRRRDRQRRAGVAK